MQISWRPIAYYIALIVLTFVASSGLITLGLAPFNEVNEVYVPANAMFSEAIIPDNGISVIDKVTIALLAAVIVSVVTMGTIFDHARRRWLLFALLVMACGTVTTALLMRLGPNVLGHIPVTDIYERTFRLDAAAGEDAADFELWAELWVCSVTVIATIALAVRKFMPRR